MCLATPGKIKSIREGRALVDFGGLMREISLGVLKGAKRGDYVLVHAGFAIGKVKKSEAEDSLEALKQLKEVLKNEVSKD